MSPTRMAALCACVSSLIAGCQSASTHTALPPSTGQNFSTPQRAANGVVAIPDSQHNSPTFLPVAFQQPGNAVSTGELPAQASTDLELSLPEFTAEVQARNPSLEAMVAAWQAAAAKYPQAVALEDPMFNANLAPASIGSSTVETAYTLELSQKFPWFGKRDARGRAANSDARSAFADAQDARLKLIETAESAFFDYYLVNRQQDLIRWDVDVMRDFRHTADTKYRATQVTQQDVLQADVELAQLERRQFELQKMHTLAVARINTLLRQPLDTPLPLPPKGLSPGEQLPDLNNLQQMALSQRPDLASLSNQVAARQAELALACKQHYPDTEVYGHYDTYWQPASTQGDLRGEVGVRLNLPIYYGRLNAAVREAECRLTERRAQLEQKRLDVQYEVRQAYADLAESEQILNLYRNRLMSIAELNVAAARTNYDVSKSSFLDLATAQRQLIDVREKHEEALALYQQRLVAMRRAIGGPLPQAPSAEEIIPR